MNEFLSYPEQLETEEWSNVRESILKRDRHFCTRCGLGSSETVNIKGKVITISLNYKYRLSLASVAKIYNGIPYNEFAEIGNKTLKICPEDWLVDDTWRFYLGVDDYSETLILVAKNEDCPKKETKHLFEVVRMVLKNGGTIYLMKRESDPIIFDNVPEPRILEHRIDLNVHHKYYLFHKRAWEYPDTALVTLCSDCHQITHQEEIVPIYTEENGSLKEMHYTPCHRCNGVGWFPEYSHIQSGVCFRCNGLRFEELITG